ncbi:DUF7601 domain-containing protein [Catenisphaera adipataccumulans]|uniref:DUF7601 domain-containing protein n=1 Tax=Catenisphaera adipataccumulans TaxID=700500 RepID=A0A7W8CVP8_9FIRM|nr:DUF5979 domain-containing protein [Catenisphaera adipataccumulans]MBB5182487.1 hypothetical protein [Catenisphaera adipataccumulans]
MTMKKPNYFKLAALFVSCFLCLFLLKAGVLAEETAPIEQQTETTELTTNSTSGPEDATETASESGTATQTTSQSEGTAQTTSEETSKATKAKSMAKTAQAAEESDTPDFSYEPEEPLKYENGKLVDKNGHEIDLDYLLSSQYVNIRVDLPANVNFMYNHLSIDQIKGVTYEENQFQNAEEAPDGEGYLIQELLKKGLLENINFNIKLKDKDNENFDYSMNLDTQNSLNVYKGKVQLFYQFISWYKGAKVPDDILKQIINSYDANNVKYVLQDTYNPGRSMYIVGLPKTIESNGMRFVFEGFYVDGEKIDSTDINSYSYISSYSDNDNKFWVESINRYSNWSSGIRANYVLDTVNSQKYERLQISIRSVKAIKNISGLLLNFKNKDTGKVYSVVSKNKNGYFESPCIYLPAGDYDLFISPTADGDPTHSFDPNSVTGYLNHCNCLLSDLYLNLFDRVVELRKDWIGKFKLNKVAGSATEVSEDGTVTVDPRITFDLYDVTADPEMEHPIDTHTFYYTGWQCEYVSSLSNETDKVFLYQFPSDDLDFSHEYKIVERAVDGQDAWITEYVTIRKNGNIYLQALNRTKTDLKVAKTVTGNTTADDSLKEFLITLESDDPNLNGDYSAKDQNGTLHLITFTNGNAQFYLRSGQSLTIEDLPYGVTFNISEQDTNEFVESGKVVTDDSDTEDSQDTIETEFNGILAKIKLGSINEVSFTNAKIADGKVTLTAKKQLNGQAPGSSVFEFVLKDASGKILQIKKNLPDGTIVFDPISFTSKDIGHTFLYTISELVQDGTNMIYDGNVYEIRITPQAVKDEKDGIYYAYGEPVITLNGQSASEIVFRNQTKPEPKPEPESKKEEPKAAQPTSSQGVQTGMSENVAVWFILLCASCAALRKLYA